MDKRKQFGISQGYAENFKSYDDDDDESAFEADLVNMEMEDSEAVIGDRTENQQTCVKWSRPEPPKLDPQYDALIFQQIDIENYIGQHLSGMPGSQMGPVPIMRMFGVTMEGNSVCCHVHGFTPCMYIGAPKGFGKGHCRPFKEALNRAVIADMRSNREGLHEVILSVDIVYGQSLMGYYGDSKFPFIKIFIALPGLLPDVKRLLEKEVIYNKFDFQHCRAYENNIDFDIRFMVDTNIVGCNWIELPSSKWRRHS